MEISEELQERVDIIKHKLKFIEQKPTVACIAMFEPLMLAGDATPELIGIAGGASVLTKSGEPSPLIHWEEILEENPDIIILAPKGFAVERTMKNINLLLDLPGFADLKAVKNNRFYIADGEQYFNDTATSTVETTELLAEIINPKQFIFGYEGEGWIKFSL